MSGTLLKDLSDTTCHPEPGRALARGKRAQTTSRTAVRDLLILSYPVCRLMKRAASP